MKASSNHLLGFVWDMNPLAISQKALVCSFQEGLGGQFCAVKMQMLVGTLKNVQVLRETYKEDMKSWIHNWVPAWATSSHPDCSSLILLPLPCLSNRRGLFFQKIYIFLLIQNYSKPNKSSPVISKTWDWIKELFCFWFVWNITAVNHFSGDYLKKLLKWKNKIILQLSSHLTSLHTSCYAGSTFIFYKWIANL